MGQSADPWAWAVGGAVGRSSWVSLLSCCAPSGHRGLGKRRLSAACSGNEQASRHHLHARDGALLTDLLHGKEHPPCRGLTPEPIRQRRTVDGAVPRLRGEGLAVVGFEILHRVSEKRGKGDIRAWIGWCLAIEERTDEHPHLLRGQPADPHRGAAASGHREIIPCAELRNLPLQSSPQEVR